MIVKETEVAAKAVLQSQIFIEMSDKILNVTPIHLTA